MNGCLAPSEIPGLSASERTIFGSIAEKFISADFCSQYSCVTPQVYIDDNNEASYIYFLSINNQSFNEPRQYEFYYRLRSQRLGVRRPDIMVHKTAEKAFYEIKPKSRSGIRAGEEKVGILRATYRFFNLPYLAGTIFSPRDHRLAYYGSAFEVKLKVERIAPGLIVYELCVRSNGLLELATLLALLTYIIRQLNRQNGSNRIDQIDLEPVFVRNRQFWQLARTLGLSMATGAATVAVAVGWRHFWKAVSIRFAARGSVALMLSAADGPLPIGELMAAGMAMWTIVDIIRLSDQLWRDAGVIAQNEA